MTRSNVPPRRPRWFYIPVRVLLVTFILTLICFAITLLLGILGTVIVALVHGVHPNMTHAYRHVAAPVAAVAAMIILVFTTVVEIRRYRRDKALAAIERSS